MTKTKKTAKIETPSFRTIVVPSYSFFRSETLIEATAGCQTSGLCRTVEEAQERITALLSGLQPATQAPDYQANEREMAAALAKFATIAIKDGGLCQSAVETAMRAGIHTVEWAIASRYLVAGWV